MYTTSLSSVQQKKHARKCLSCFPLLHSLFFLSHAQLGEPFRERFLSRDDGDVAAGAAAFCRGLDLDDLGGRVADAAGHADVDAPDLALAGAVATPLLRRVAHDHPVGADPVQRLGQYGTTPVPVHRAVPHLPRVLPAPKDAVRRPHGQDGGPAALLPPHPARHFLVQLSQAVVHVVRHDPAVRKDRVIDLQRHVGVGQLLGDGPAGREQGDPGFELGLEP
mmetsp:Transcript_30733/g.65878  ORF Transcript_30733/g.65878 Transcript_30733/m.65878 type:complete len:221 (+) Transcript_30733:1472-2134(+)